MESLDIEDIPVPPPDWDSNDSLLNVTAVDIPFCNVVIAEDLFAPGPFEATRRLVRNNEMAIRFGASNNMMTLLDGTKSEQKDYIVGLLASSLLMAVFFAIWCIVMLIFKCLGHRRGGFLAGRFVRPTKPQFTAGESIRQEQDGSEGNITQSQAIHENSQCDTLFSQEQVSPASVEMTQEDSVERKWKESQEEIVWLKKCQRQEIRLFRTSVTLIISCLVIITSSGMFCYYGEKYVRQSITSVEGGLQRVQLLAVGGIILVDTFLNLQEAALNGANQQLLQLNGMCPNLSEKLCETVVPEVQNCTFQDIPYLQESFQDMFSFVYEARGFISNELDDAHDHLAKIYDDVEELLNANQNLEWVFWVAFTFALALSLCCVVIILGIYLAHKGKLTACQKFLRRQVMFPLFCFLVLVAFAFSFAFTIASIAASDWCIDSPNPKVTYILNQASPELNSVVYKLANFYVNSCPSSMHPPETQTVSNRLVGFMEMIADFSADIRSINATAWTETCGTDHSILDDFATFLEISACEISTALAKVDRYFWCRQWNPLYTIFMYEAVCDNAQSGLGWISGTMFTIVLFSFMVLLLRAGAFDIEDEESYLRNARRFRVCCYRLATCACCRQKEESKDAKTTKNDDPIVEGDGTAACPDCDGPVMAQEQAPMAPLADHDDAPSTKEVREELKTDTAHIDDTVNSRFASKNDDFLFGMTSLCGGGIEVAAPDKAL